MTKEQRTKKTDFEIKFIICDDDLKWVKAHSKHERNEYR